MLGIERSSLPGNVDELRVELVAIVAQLESCDYACEGGRLGNNVAFVRLKEIAAGAA